MELETCHNSNDVVINYQDIGKVIATIYFIDKTTGEEREVTIDIDKEHIRKSH